MKRHNINEESEKALSPVLVSLFKYLNEEKKNYKTKDEMMKAISGVLPFFNIPENQILYIYELYAYNYREDGNYKSLTKDNFVDPRKMKQRTTTNTTAYKYTEAKLPFKASNLQGYWDIDSRNVPYYVVLSYGWYPIYVFKKDKWYEVLDKYSSSTSKHIRYSDPFRWSSALNTSVYALDRKEMEKLVRGSNHQEVMKMALDRIKENEPSLISNRMLTQKNNPYYDEDDGDLNQEDKVNVKYKVKSIDIDGNSAIVNVDIYDVIKINDEGKEIKTKDNYLKGGIRGITPEKVEKRLKPVIQGKFYNYLRTLKPVDAENLDNDPTIEFRFDHLKK